MARRPLKYWENIGHQRQAFAEIARSLNINKLDDWYLYNSSDLHQHGVGSLIGHYYKNSVYDAVSTIYPDHHWKRWKFGRVPEGYWEDQQHQRDFMEDFFEDRGLRNPRERYQTRTSDLHRSGGSTILKLYKNSLKELMKTIYPEITWEDWRFDSGREHYLHANEDNTRLYFDSLGKKMGVKELDDWYQLGASDVVEHNGQAIIQVYKSYPEALKAAYPEHNWMDWRFGKVANGYWDDRRHVEDAIAWIAARLSIQQLDDWYAITVKQFESLGKISLWRHFGGIVEVLRYLYPEHSWDDAKFTTAQWKHQNILSKAVSEILPVGTTIYFNYVHPSLNNPLTGRNLTLDVYVPSMGLAFEYEGEHHFGLTFQKGKININDNDKQKRELCKANNITLIEVPYWWDLSQSALHATIFKSRPDLVPPVDGRPIPESIPPSAKSKLSTKKEPVHDEWSYIGGFGAGVGNTPNCSGCSKKLTSSKEPRILVQLIRSKKRVYYCLDPKCILQMKSAQRHDPKYPIFDGRIKLARNEYRTALPHLDGIEWIK